MNTWARKSFKIGVLSAGALLFAGTAATAANATTLTSVGNNGIASGLQLNSVVQAPVDVCGNAAGVLGAAQANCRGGAWATDNGGGDVNEFSGFNAGILSGAQANSIIQVPIDVCGNAVGVLGFAQASCQGGSSATIGGGNGGNGGGYSGGSGNGGGYAYGGGGGGTTGTSTNESAVASKSMHVRSNQDGGNACSPTLTSIGNNGILSGAQINSVIQAPIEISGNAVGVLGGAQAYSVGGAWASC